MAGVISIIIVILVLGVAVDIGFNLVNDTIRRRRGLGPAPRAARTRRIGAGAAGR